MTDDAPKPRAIWQRLGKLMASQRMLLALNSGVVGVCGTMAIFGTSKWIGLASAFIAGFAISSMIFGVMHMRLVSSFRDVEDSFEGMAEMNRALIHGKFKMMVAEIEAPDDEAPTAPKNLH